ncbi:MAG: hypothetical protein ACRDHG_14225 [Anaerolineales bacterium]
MDTEVFSLGDKPDYADRIEALSREAWPAFMLNGDVTHWGRLFDVFAPFQLLICDPAGELLAVGHTVPLVWNGTLDDLPETIDAIIARALEARKNGQAPNTVSALAAMVPESHRGRGLSTRVIQQMKKQAAGSGCGDLIAPVRPTLKDRYPLIPMERYVQWTSLNGEPFDPWIRVHARLGAEFLKVADCTMTVASSVVDWERWTGMAFPESGQYVVQGALQPVSIDRGLDLGTYQDPNVWMRHPVAP